MSQSSMVTKQWWANASDYTAGRTDKIRGIVIHHAASTSLDSIGQVFSQPGRGGSAHYGVGGSQVHQYVREEYCAWHCSNWNGNNATIGIETTNSTGAPDWKVADDTFNTLVKLVAEIAKRNGLGKLWINPDADYPALSGHKDWYGASTVCPGPYLYPRLQEICDRANAINYPTAELKWTKLDKPTKYVTIRDTHLYDFNKANVGDLVAIKSYANGTEIGIYGKCENKTIKKTFLLTEYSYTQKITNGFKEDALTIKQEEQKPEEKPTPEQPEPAQPEPEKPTENPVVIPDAEESSASKRGLSDEEYAKVYEEMVKKGQIIVENAKKEGALIPMSNKVYDILKIVAIVILPLISAIYVALSKIWGFGFGTEIDQTIQIIIAALNTILGVALVKSSSDYKKNQ